MCLEREERIESHYTRRAYIRNCNSMDYCPGEFPNTTKLETWKSALDEYFARFVMGEDNSENKLCDVIAQIIQLVNDNRWKRFKHRTFVNKPKDYSRRGYYATLLVESGKFNFDIIVKERGRKRKISESKGPKKTRYEIVWEKICVKFGIEGEIENE